MRANGNLVRDAVFSGIQPPDQAVSTSVIVRWGENDVEEIDWQRSLRGGYLGFGPLERRFTGSYL